MTTPARTPPFAYRGGKTRLATRIAAALPRHQHYVEPFGGSLAVLLAKPVSLMETVNDIDERLITFWRVLRERPAELARLCALTPHSRAEHQQAWDADLTVLNELEVARLVWIQISQSRGGTLRRTGWRMYVDPAGSSTSMPGYLDGYTERMAAAAERLHRVSLECRPALDVIAQYGAHRSCCLYVDPPYLGSSRTAGGAGYRYEFKSDAEHIELLEALVACRAAVVLSGYPSALYDEALVGWSRLEVPAKTGQGRSRTARCEVLWSNRSIAEQLSFDDAVGFRPLRPAMTATFTRFEGGSKPYDTQHL